MSTIPSSTFTVSIEKSPSETSGLLLSQDINNKIIVNGILNGPFENTMLQTSMEIVSVNGIRCCNGDMTSEFVKSMIDDASGQVTLIAREIVYSAVVVSSNEPPVPSAPEVLGDHTDPPPMNQQIAQYNSSQHQQIHQNFTADPPNGCRDGGRWTKIRYPGRNTFFMCLALAFWTCCLTCFGTCAFRCPIDKKDVYLVDGKVNLILFSLHYLKSNKNL